MAHVLILLCIVCEVFAAKVHHSYLAMKERDRRSKDAEFPIHPVEKCPMNRKDWDSASKRLHCNDTHGYNCLPEETLSSFVEFCYPFGNWILIDKGNCPRLSSNRLKHYACHDFKCGCPDKDYYNNEIYNYPVCLRIFKECFTSNSSCLKDRPPNTEEKTTTISTSVSDTEQQRRKEECTDTVYIGIIIALVVLLLASVMVNIWFCLKQQQPGCFPPSMYTKVLKNDFDMVHVERGDKNVLLNKVQDPLSVGDIDKYVLVDYTVENEEIFHLLKIQCLNGVHIGFHYVNKSRVLQPDKKYIFHQRDENGCTLLHYAAQGGSITIFKEILNTDPEINIGVKCFRGQTALHFAVRYKQNKMTEYLITEHRDCFTQASEDLLSVSRHNGRGESVTPSNLTGQFEPFHWIAWNGDTWLHHLWKEAHLTVTGLTKNGLDILDIACMNNQYEFCRHVIENEKEINVEKVDASGWNCAHYAAMWNNVKLLELLAKKKETQMILAVTKLEKTALHIACEYGNFEVANHLVQEYTDLLCCMDSLEWNALHYAAKGGNKQIFELLLKKGLKIDYLTKDKKTLLHIASIYKQIDICKFVAKTFSEHHKELLNQKTTNQGWSAAHYVAVEVKDLQKQKEVIDILRQYGMNLKERTNQGVSILDVAIVYLDEELIKLIVSPEYREILDITKEVILKGKVHTDDRLILKILDDAAEKIEAEC